MDPETKEQKTGLRLSEILRYSFYGVVIVLLLSCIGFLFMGHLQTMQRLDAIDEKVYALELTMKKLIPSSPTYEANQNRLTDLAERDLHVRLRRTVTIGLQSLEKRLKVLEIRYGEQIPSFKNGNTQTSNDRRQTCGCRIPDRSGIS